MNLYYYFLRAYLQDRACCANSLGGAGGSGRCCWREYKWHLARQFMVHVLWFWVEWPVPLLLEAGIFLFGRRIAVNLSSHEDHVYLIYGIKLWVMPYMFLHSRKLWMCCISKPFCDFLSTVYKLRWGHVLWTRIIEDCLSVTRWLSHRMALAIVTLWKSL